MFGHTITLWCSTWHEFVKLFHIVLIEDPTRNSKFVSAIKSQKLYFLVTMILHFTLKFFELIKYFTLVFH